MIIVILLIDRTVQARIAKYYKALNIIESADTSNTK